MYPYRLERDTDIIDWSPATATLSTTDTVHVASNYLVRSLGVLNADFATLHINALSGVVAAFKVRCAGIHITGPQVGEEFTPYAVSVHAQCADLTLRPFMFIGESPITITSGAAGDSVADVRLMAFPVQSGSDSASLSRQFIVLIKEKTAGRAVCFGVAALAGASASGDLGIQIHMSIRRLIGINPSLIDTTKL